jgi:hypothetical protein
VRVEKDRLAVRAKWEKQLAHFESAAIRFPDEEKRSAFFALAGKALRALD